jgi:hypothetical protein
MGTADGRVVVDGDYSYSIDIDSIVIVVLLDFVVFLGVIRTVVWTVRK